MVSSYVRIRCSLDDAMARYGGWIALPETAPARIVRERDKIDLSLENESWLGLAVFIYTAGEWTVIEEISGGLGERPAESWLDLAGGGDLVYAGYNDAVPYAQLIVVENGRLVREFLDDEQDPSANVNTGRLPEERARPFTNWIDAARWVDDDEEKLPRPDNGWLWIHHPE